MTGSILATGCGLLEMILSAPLLKVTAEPPLCVAANPALVIAPKKLRQSSRPPLTASLLEGYMLVKILRLSVLTCSVACKISSFVVDGKGKISCFCGYSCEMAASLAAFDGPGLV